MTSSEPSAQNSLLGSGRPSTPQVTFDLGPDSIDSSIALDGVYRWGLVFHCNARVNDGECPRCHRRVPMSQPEFKCPDCTFVSTVRSSVEYHFLAEHTNICPVCRVEPSSLPAGGVGGRGCACS